MSWKFRKFLTPIQLDCMLYDALEEGRIVVEDILEDKEQIENVLVAIDLIQDLEAAMLDRNLIVEN